MIIIPKGRLIILFLIPLFFYIGSYVNAALSSVGLWCNGLILIIAAGDILFSLSNLKYTIAVERTKPYSIGRINQLEIKFINLSRFGQKIRFKLGLPPWIEDQTETKAFAIMGLTEKTVTFSLRPTRRGSFVVESLYMRITSKGRLFYFDKRCRINAAIQVYPDIKQLNHYLKFTKNNRDYKLGINKTRWMGNGFELESLREYQKDDDSKFIDWKASTRLNRPISKVFQMETNNQITIALDCGRLMTAEQHGLNTLDHAINSLLILSHIAFNVGDSLSIVAFSDRIIGEISHLKGRDSLRKITPFLSKLKPEFVESNYSLLFNYLSKFHISKPLKNLAL